MKFRRIASLKTCAGFRAYLAQLGLDLPVDDEIDAGSASPLAAPLYLSDGFKIGNRFAILPMEGWDATREGRPSEHTCRRWERFGSSGAKFIWGGEAVAVRHDGRANPNQLLINEQNLASLASLRERLLEAHRSHFGTTSDLLIGLQLTHSGRFSRPNRFELAEPKILYHHPILDRRFSVDLKQALLTDDDISRLIDDFVAAAVRAARAGFDFVDIKHCHGYLGHEFLSAVDRAGAFGGPLAHRLHFLERVVAGIRAEAPGLRIGVRLSLFDFAPFRADVHGTGEPELPPERPYRYAFGGDGSGTGIDLHEPVEALQKIQKMGIELVCTTAGSPYYNPHIQRPALFPPSDGYLPPEDPLVGVVRQINATAELKRQFAQLRIIGSGYSYLQEFLPHVAQAVVRKGMVDAVGLGRMVLSYPELPADVLAGRPLQRKRICRTFSDCTTAPRNGLISGCYPLDAYYKNRPEARKLKAIKHDIPLNKGRQL